MQVIGAVEQGSWLVERAGAWGTAGAAAGTGFESYARILHPLEAWRQNTNIEDEHGLHPVENELWRWADVANRVGKVIHPLVQYTALVDIDAVAAFADGWRVSQPTTGWLDPELLARLTRHLTATTNNPHELLAGVWNGWGDLYGSATSLTFMASSALTAEELTVERERMEAEIEASSQEDVRDALAVGAFLHMPGRDYILFTTSAHELADPGWVYRAGFGWRSGIPGVMPQLVWPADHSWVVASEIDWDSTIIAGPRSLIDAILADTTFEAYELTETSDLSWDGDHINRRNDPPTPGQSSR